LIDLVGLPHGLIPVYSGPMSESSSSALPQPLVYLIHDDQDRALADVVAQHLAAAGMPAWSRGRRAPKGQGADIILKRARAAVLLQTAAASQSQLVHVDLVRASRDSLPLVRLLLAPEVALFETGKPDDASPIAAYPHLIGDVPAQTGLDAAALDALSALVRPLAERRGLSMGLPAYLTRRKPDTAEAVSDARPKLTLKSAAQSSGNAAGIGLKMSLLRLAPLALLVLAGLGAGRWWLMRAEAAREMDRARQREAARPALTPSMQDLASARLAESPAASSLNSKVLPAGFVRAGYEAEPAATDEQVAAAAEKLQITKINRSAFRTVAGKRFCDLEVSLVNPTDETLPVVALSIGILDKAKFNLAPRVMKIERRWIGPGGSRVITSKLYDLPEWTQSITVKVSSTKS
jgi:hypothetical protein